MWIVLHRASDGEPFFVQPAHISTIMPALNREDANAIISFAGDGRDSHVSVRESPEEIMGYIMAMISERNAK